jgi:SNF2 family DNA or RNA helicase
MGAMASSVGKKATSRSAQAAAVDGPLKADAVAYVHLVTRDDGAFGVTVEPALRYLDPLKNTVRVEVVRVLKRLEGALAWKNVQGYRLEIQLENIPVLGSVSANRATYLGQTATQFLGQLLSGEASDRVVLDPALNVTYDPKVLALTRFEVGKKQGNQRSIRFTFSNGKHTIDSEEIRALSEEGRVSSDYVWQGNRIYKLGTSLATIAKHINRSGVNTLEKVSAKPLEALTQLEDEREHPLHPIAIFRLSLELGALDFQVDESWAEFHEWRANFERKRIPTLPKADYGFDLRDYQHNGLSWIWSLYNRRLCAFLADDMGLGKTHQVLAFLSCLYRNPKNRPNLPSIVVAPTSVVAAWKQKLDRYDTGLKWYVYHGSSRELPPHGVDLIITTYGVLQRDKILRDRDWHIAIADESQAIKNANTSTSRISRALKASFRIAMTGTPVENSATDLWSTMEFLLPGYLGSQQRFKRLYGGKGDTLPAEKSQLIKKLITPFLLRRTKSQVLTELPEKTEEIIPCELTVEQRRIYNDYLQGQEARKIRKNLEDGTRLDYTGILALLTKLKQVCDHPFLPEITGKISGYDGSSVDPNNAGKWDALQEIVGEALGSGLKVVVFTQFLGMLDIMSNWLRREGIGYAELRGDTRDREGMMNRFARDPECKVFLCSLMAGGLGIDLTSASVCIHYDRWWNPARENQATDRLHRIGQTRGVQVFKLQSPNTVEDRIARIIERKIALSGALIEDSSLGLKSFSREELLSLLTELAGT